jgi:alpha-glucosidase
MQENTGVLEFYPGKLQEALLEGDVCTIISDNDTILKIYCISDDILRFRYATDGYFEDDFSYAISEKYNHKVGDVVLKETTDSIELHTETLVCRVSKSNLAIDISDQNGNLILEDEKGFHWERNQEHGGNIVQMTKKIQTKEMFYGLGDKPTDLNIKGKRFENWGTDNYGYEKNADPLYKSIPFYYGLHNGIGYGVFFDNTFRAYFDFGSERNTATSFWAHGGEMNYYFIAGPQLMDVCERYTLLTGTPEMPPLWALGFQQCKWSYYPESNVKEVTSKMRELEIPCDAIYLDIDYMDGFRCFTWDKEKFPDPKRMVKELADDGFKTMVIIDPGIKIDKEYSVFTEGLEKGYFCKRPDGPYVNGKVWPGECYFPDFTRPEVRTWWASLYEELIQEIGVAGVWNDMNEPALFEVESKTFPEDVLHDYDGHLCSHRKAHNIYGMQMARATADGVKQFSGGKRSLIITRSGYSGLQRYSSVWTGDNIASYEHLWIADVQVQRLAISGISFAGSDIGGFISQPTGELFTRWIQMAIFHPFCRVHSSGDHGDQEPWSFGEKYTDLFREAVELRYKLLPYIYTSFYHYHKYGRPMIRPIVFHDQEDTQNHNRDHEFLCGPDMLVVPVLSESAVSRNVYLPKGDWYSFWDGTLYPGKTEIVHKFNIHNFPFFVKAGAVIPLYPVMQYTGEKEIEVVDLKVFYTVEKYASEWYEDEHDGYAYENKHYRKAKFTVEGSPTEFKIEQTIKGKYDAPFHSYKLDLVGLPFIPSVIEIDGESMAYNKEGNVIKAGFKSCVLKLA